MVKRAKLTLEPDPVENEETLPPEPSIEKAETPRARPAAPPVKESAPFKTILFAGLTIASLIIFKRKIF